MSRSADSTQFSNCLATPAPCHFARTAIPRICPSSPPFFAVDDIASDSADDLASFINRHEHVHVRQSLAHCLECQHRIQERLARVPVAIVFKRRAQRFQNSRNITVRRSTYQECSALCHHWRTPLSGGLRTYEGTPNSSSSILSTWLLACASNRRPSRGS